MNQQKKLAFFPSLCYTPACGLQAESPIPPDVKVEEDSPGFPGTHTRGISTVGRAKVLHWDPNKGH